MDSVSFARGAHWKGFLEYHFEWCPKKRYKVLRQRRFKDFLLECLQETTKRIGVVLVEVGIQDNHVHVVVDLESWQPPSWVVERLKCESSRALFQYEPNFRKRYPAGHFWSPGKFYRTVSEVTSEQIREYVRRQDHRQSSLGEYQ